MDNKLQVFERERVKAVYDFMRVVSNQRKDIIQHFTKKWTEDGYLSNNTNFSKYYIIVQYIERVKIIFFRSKQEVKEEEKTFTQLIDLLNEYIKEEDYINAMLILQKIKKKLLILI